MRLSDVMAHAGLTVYPIAALLIFLAVFIVMTRRTLARERKPEYTRAASLPLRDDTPSCPRTPCEGVQT